MATNIQLPLPKTIARPRLHWSSLIWIAGLHVAALFAPFTFSWSGLLIAAALSVLTGLGITLGYHRLLTHRSFQTSRPVEYFFSLLGVLANEGGPLKWVATHRKHHAFADRAGDPHSPLKGFWWAHMGWWFRFDPIIDDPVEGLKNVKDLARDPVHRFFESWQLLPLLAMGGTLYGLGSIWGLGLSWLVWGMFVRTVFTLHSTWLVNSAAHTWGYRSYATRDRSTNLWWVAILSLGEGWHNNHHAFQRSARHGLRWWEVDFTYAVIRLLGMLGLAWDIHLAPKPGPGAPARRWRLVMPRKSAAPLVQSLLKP